ncbi:MarR family transcriptional regulator [Pseudomonas sp. GD03860]|uniref:MarR family winged helix-turn-helix transcriptional regulator n=1 Tax=Pseudomonas TaxID=286 RepID=UPI0023642E18|nr:MULTISPECIES: MarR family transcriptional regulator [Pseudomonas]MDD2056434.1 MarR family transcriptional regulator [Pseudomonas putida]MDH0638868.1 MarR family transcriptional regulator [Pseudomonas sp. GD03860]
MPHYTPENFQSCTLGLLLARAALVKDRILDSHLQAFGVTAAQFKVLIIVAQYDVDTPAELCRFLALDSGSMTRMLDRLEQKDLIVRRRCPDDRRQVRLELSEEGQKLADQLPHVGAAAMNELLGVLAADELASLEGLLTKILLAAGDTLTAQRTAAAQPSISENA